MSVINKRQQLAQKRISKIEQSVRESIDIICEEENFRVSYAEINSAMLNLMKTFNGHELKELWKDAK